MKVKTSEGTYKLPSGNRKTMKTITLKKIDLSKADGCQHPDIDPYKTYWVKYDTDTMIGTFDKQWYGWNFTWFGTAFAGLQLNTLDEIWEIVE